MTLRVNPTFAASLSAATISNNAWSAAFKNGLGASRRVTCKIAPAGTPEENAYASGTKFRDAAISGDMAIEGGIVTSYGTTSNLTTALAADLAAGVAVLRIEGNGNWIEGRLGLAGSNADFLVPENPTTTNSIAVTPNLRIKPPPFLPSGTGYSPPALGDDAPAYVVIEDWRNPQNVVEVGRIPFNNRLDNWTFTDPEIAAGMGDVRVTNSTGIVTYIDIEFGAIMFSMNAAANAEGGRTLHQVLVMMKPTSGPGQNWPNYPRYSGYRLGSKTFDAPVTYGVSNTFPEAFKAKLYNGSNALMHTWDMNRDNLPINSSQLSEVPTKTKPLRPHMHCGQMLFWQSHKPKMSAKSKKWFPGMDMRAVRPSLGKEKAAYAGVMPMAGNSGGNHGWQHWFASGKWANAANEDAVRADLSLDPYLYPINPGSTVNNYMQTPDWAAVHGIPASDFGEVSYGAARVMGWGYEPGSYCMHDQTTGPGGVRIDRGVWAGPLMIALTDPNWVHLRDNTPISEMFEHWKLGYFNQGCHYFTDVRNMTTLPLNELLAGDWSYCRTFYGPNSSYTSGGTNYAVPLFASRLGSFASNGQRPHGGQFCDANYRLPWNGYAPDNLHNYQTPGDVAMHYNSPAHAFSAKHRYIAHLMIGLGESRPTTSAGGYVGSREHAWKILQHSTMWKLASDHPVLGVRQSDIEARLAIELNQVYQEYYLPMYVENSQDPHFVIMKRFGVPHRWNGSRWGSTSFGLTFYMAGALLKMRQFGLFNKMWNQSEASQKALLMLIRMLDAGSIQWFTQTRGSYIGGNGDVYNGAPFIPIDHTVLNNPDIPLNWGDWRDRKYPGAGQEDWIHRSDGSFRGPDSSEQLRASWPKLRLEFFHDIPCLYSWDEVQEAADIVEDFHKQWDDRIKSAAASGTTQRSLALMEWSIPTAYAFLQSPNPDDVETL
jgi:hypothetical protein